MSTPTPRPFVVTSKEIHCPACERLLHSRRRETCEWCGILLPQELRASAEESAAIEAEMKSIEAERAARREDEAEEKKRVKARKTSAVTAATIGTLPSL